MCTKRRALGVRQGLESMSPSCGLKRYDHVPKKTLAPGSAREAVLAAGCSRCSGMYAIVAATMASSAPLPPHTRPIPPPALPPGLRCTGYEWICVYELNDQPPSPPNWHPPEPPSPPAPPPLTEAEILEQEFLTGTLLLWYYTNLGLLAAAIIRCIYVICFRGAPKHGKRPGDPGAMPTDASNAVLESSSKKPPAKGDDAAEKQALLAESGGVEASDGEGLRPAAEKAASLPLPLKEGSGAGAPDSQSRASSSAKRRLEAAEARRSSSGGATPKKAPPTKGK